MATPISTRVFGFIGAYLNEEGTQDGPAGLGAGTGFLSFRRAFAGSPQLFFDRGAPVT